MKLHLRTSRVSYAGPDRLDITRKSADDFGLAFAPSWALLAPVLRARHANGDIDAIAWGSYVAAYTDEMRASYQVQRHVTATAAALAADGGDSSQLRYTVVTVLQGTETTAEKWRSGRDSKPSDSADRAARRERKRHLALVPDAPSDAGDPPVSRSLRDTTRCDAGLIALHASAEVIKAAVAPLPDPPPPARRRR